MKKKILIILVLLLTITGCFKRDKMDNIEIITTSYPVKYLVDNMYGYNATIDSIYPLGVDIDKYELTKKQIKNYASADIFIYNGLSKEKRIAASFLNENKNIKVIDTTKGLSVKNGMEELWLCPSNYLMLAQNIKNELISYANTTIVEGEIEANYEKTKLTISKFDADLKMVAESSDDKTIIVGDETLSFLEKYGFDVISIYKDGEIVQKNFQEAKNRFTSKSSNYIYVLDTYDKENLDIKSLKSNGAKVKEIKTMSNITDEEQENGTDYSKFMSAFIDNIKEETLSK